MAAVRGMLLGSFVLSTLAAIVCAQTYQPLWTVTDWQAAHATFYGGQDASGTMGGACGYSNLYSQGYGTNTVALSNALFNNGLTCGACFQIQCQTAATNWCYPGKTIVVTATNNCPEGSYGGWCDSPKLHFDLAYPAFTQLAQAVGGVIPIVYKRVSCNKQGGVRFTIHGNPWFDNVLVTNVAGSGDVQAVAIRGSKTDFIPMSHGWGQYWQSGAILVGQSLTFRVTVGSGSAHKALDFWDVAPSDWQFGQTFETDYNFY